MEQFESGIGVGEAVVDHFLSAQQHYILTNNGTLYRWIDNKGWQTTWKVPKAGGVTEQGSVALTDTY